MRRKPRIRLKSIIYISLMALILALGCVVPGIHCIQPVDHSEPISGDILNPQDVSDHARVIAISFVCPIRVDSNGDEVFTEVTQENEDAGEADLIQIGDKISFKDEFETDITFSTDWVDFDPPVLEITPDGPFTLYRNYTILLPSASERLIRLSGENGAWASMDFQFSFKTREPDGTKPTLLEFSAGGVTISSPSSSEFIDFPISPNMDIVMKFSEEMNFPFAFIINPEITEENILNLDGITSDNITFTLKLTGLDIGEDLYFRIVSTDNGVAGLPIAAVAASSESFLKEVRNTIKGLFGASINSTEPSYSDFSKSLAPCRDISGEPLCFFDGVSTMVPRGFEIQAPLARVRIDEPTRGQIIDTSTVGVSGIYVWGLTGDDEDKNVTSIIVNDSIPALMTDGHFAATLTGLNDGPLTITAEADAADGKAGYDQIRVLIAIPPDVTIFEPEDGSFITADTVEVRVNVSDEGSGIDSVEINGLKATRSLWWGYYWVDLEDLDEGPLTITAVATDKAGNIGTDSINVTVDTRPPSISISSPTDGAFITTSTIVVSGMVSEPLPGSDIASAIVNGVSASFDGGSFTAVLTDQPEGDLEITATVVDNAGHSSSHSVNVFIDTIPPDVTIFEPEDGSFITDDTVEVRVDVSDEGSGIDSVEINGLKATRRPPYYWVELEDLAEGPLTITAVVTDEAGNIGMDSINVTIHFPPIIYNISPVFAHPSEPISIIGEYFDSFDPVRDQITFNGIPIDLSGTVNGNPVFIGLFTNFVEATQDRIDLNLPYETISGIVAVTVEGWESNGVNFTVCRVPPDKVVPNGGDRSSIAYQEGPFWGDPNIISSAHISSIANNELHYSVWLDGEWQTWVIDAVDHDAGEKFGANTSIALDPNGNPGICYTVKKPLVCVRICPMPGECYTECEPPVPMLKYAYIDEGSWKYDLVDSNNVKLFSCSLAFDPLTGYPRISYAGTQNGYCLKYASMDASENWNITIVDSEYDYQGKENSLAIDSQGRGWIIYSGPGVLSPVPLLRFAYENLDGTWTKDYVGTPDFFVIGHNPSLSLVNDTPHFTFSDPNFSIVTEGGGIISPWVEVVITGGALMYVYRDQNGIWYREKIDSDVYKEEVIEFDSFPSSSDFSEYLISKLSMVSSSFVASDNGILKVSYYDANNILKLATMQSDDTWVMDIVDVGIDVGEYNSLALDGNGEAKIAYYDSYNNQLFYFQEDNRNKVKPSSPEPPSDCFPDLFKQLFINIDELQVKVNEILSSNTDIFDFNPFISTLIREGGIGELLLSVLYNGFRFYFGELGGTDHDAHIEITPDPSKYPSSEIASIIINLNDRYIVIIFSKYMGEEPDKFIAISIMVNENKISFFPSGIEYDLELLFGEKAEMLKAFFGSFRSDYYPFPISSDIQLPGWTNIFRWFGFDVDDFEINGIDLKIKPISSMSFSGSKSTGKLKIIMPIKGKAEGTINYTMLFIPFEIDLDDITINAELKANLLPNIFNNKFDFISGESSVTLTGVNVEHADIVDAVIDGIFGSLINKKAKGETVGVGDVGYIFSDPFDGPINTLINDANADFDEGIDVMESVIIINDNLTLFYRDPN